MKKLFILLLLSQPALYIATAQEDGANRTFARKAVLFESYLSTSLGYSLSWHQPLVIFKKTGNSSRPSVELGYLNGSIGIGYNSNTKLLFNSPKYGLTVPHSITANFSFHHTRKQYRVHYLEMGYTGIFLHAADKFLQENGRRGFGEVNLNKNGYAGGPMLGIRHHGQITNRSNLVLRINAAFLIQKDGTLGHSRFLFSEQSSVSTQTVIQPMLGISFGIGF
jgi:hypothetical protein